MIRWFDLHHVVDLHWPESDSEGLNAAVPRVERATCHEKEALPAGQRQCTSRCRCRRRLVRLASACNLRIASMIRWLDAHIAVDLHRLKSDSEGLHAGASRVERATYREKDALPAGQRQ